MWEKIERCLEGNFDYESGSLDFSCAKIEISIPVGGCCEGSFRIYSTPECLTDGYIYTTDLRMECLTPEFAGCDEEITFCFHGENMEEGEVVKGFFNVISNHGEYYLPFVVSIQHTTLNSSIGTIKNLFHFANLAKSDWKEAVKLFYLPEFTVLFGDCETAIYDSYRGLSVYSGNEQNVEEFLIQINKKQAVEFLLGQQELNVELSGNEGGCQVLEQEIEIIRNGWGYTALNVDCEGDFVFTEKEFLTEDDFLGNRCRLPIFVDIGLCRKGKNYGQVVLYNFHVCLTLPVTVRVGEALNYDLTKKRITVQLMEFYLAFRMKKISAAVWQKETGKLVDKLVAFNENDVAARLFQAQLFLSRGNRHEAEWILNHAVFLMEQQEMENGTLWAYYLYLTTLMSGEENYGKRIAEEVNQIYKKNPSQWRVAWLLLYLSEEYSKSSSAKWLFLEKQFARGCTSPILYVEALYLAGNNPALLRRLNAYELQVLSYGARHQLLGAELVEQLLYLTGRVREYSPVLFGILVRLYEKKADVRVLQEICTQLIKGCKQSYKYFKWYQKGVEAQLRITNLYEYYMMSMDLTVKQPLPKALLMYFSYQNNLDYEHSAYLYRYIMEHKTEYEELYTSYRLRIEYFVMEQIQKLHMNENLAALYRMLLTSDMVTEETAKALSKLLFAHRIWVEDLRLRKIIVYHAGHLQPREYMLQEGAAWFPLYGNDYTILFEDGWGNRFVKSVNYTLEKLMQPGKFLRLVAHYERSCTELDLYLCQMQNSEMNQESAERALRVAASGVIAPEIKQSIYIMIMQYYYDTDNLRALDDYLEWIPFEELGSKERATVLNYMVLRGKYDIAYQWLVHFGPYFADTKTLVRLASEMMRRSNMIEDEVLTETAIYVFRKGKYDSTILSYLILYFQGMTRQMRELWKAARAFEVDCYKLSERIMIQMLYSGAFVGEKLDIFRYYVSQGAKQEVEKAFLSQCAYDYFVKERLTESFVFQEIGYLCQRGEEIDLICKLAYLKFYAENPKEITNEEKPLIEAFLDEMLRQGIHLNFFRELKEFRHLIGAMSDKTIVEYRANSGVKVRIHYVVVNESGDACEYVTEDMADVYGGVCFKEFVLFFGENLQYYITEEKDGKEQLTESGNIQKSDTENEYHSTRYEMVNDILLSKSMQDYDTLDKLLEEYCRREYWNKEMFHLQ